MPLRIDLRIFLIEIDKIKCVKTEKDSLAIERRRNVDDFNLRNVKFVLKS